MGCAALSDTETVEWIVSVIEGWEETECPSVELMWLLIEVSAEDVLEEVTAGALMADVEEAEVGGGATAVLIESVDLVSVAVAVAVAVVSTVFTGAIGSTVRYMVLTVSVPL